MFFRLAAALLVAVLGLGVVGVATAQSPCTLPLAGRVTDHESGEGLAGATVVLLPSQEAAQTDPEGHFHFHVCPGKYQVQVHFIGYQSEEAELRVAAAVVRNFALHPEAIRLQGAVVQGERAVAPTPQASASLSGQALQATRGQALGEALQKIAGVTAIQTGPSVFKPMIHGLHSNRVAIMNNGVRQEGQQWGQEHGPEIDPFVASELTVVKGAAGVRYGSDAVGGVVLVQPRALRDSAGTGAELNLVGMSNNRLGAASGTVEGNLRRLPALSWRVQGTLKQAGNTRTPDYWLDNTGFREHNLAAAAGWRRPGYGVEVFVSQFNARQGILSSAIVGNQADLQAAIDRGRPATDGAFSYRIDRPYQQLRHNLAKLSGFVKLPRAGRLTATLAQQQDFRDEFDVVRASSTAGRLNRPQLSYRNYTTTGELIWEQPVRGPFSGSVGLSGTYQRNRYAPGSRQFIPFYTNIVAGLFALERWQQGRWLLEAGLRLDRRDLRTQRLVRTVVADSLRYGVQHQRFAYWTPAASLGAVLDAGPHLTLRADAGLVQRAPAANERLAQGLHNAIYEEGYDVSRPAGAPGLRPETSYNLGLTATLHEQCRLNGELTVYQHLINGYIYQVVQGSYQTIQGTFPLWRTQQTDALLRGADVQLSYQLASRWLLTGRGAAVRARNRSLRDYLVFVPADRGELALRRELLAPAGARHWQQAFAQLSLTGVRRQTRTPGPEYDLQPAPAGYWLLGAEVGTTLRLGRQPLELSLAGTNLLNARYREYLNRFRYFAQDQGRNLALRLRLPLELTPARRAQP